MIEKLSILIIQPTIIITNYILHVTASIDLFTQLKIKNESLLTLFVKVDNSNFSITEVDLYLEGSKVNYELTKEDKQLVEEFIRENKI